MSNFANNQRKTGKSYKIAEKQTLIMFYEENKFNGWSKQALAQKFKMPVSVLNNILKNKKELMSVDFPKTKKRIVTFRRYQQIDIMVYEWFVLKLLIFFTITSDMVKSMSMKIASKLSISEFKASNGWLHAFKN